MNKDDIYLVKLMLSEYRMELEDLQVDKDNVKTDGGKRLVKNRIDKLKTAIKHNEKMLKIMERAENK